MEKAALCAIMTITAGVDWGSGGKNVPFAPREFGRIGYDTPVAQPTTFHLKPFHIDDANYDACCTLATLSHTDDDPGGDVILTILEVAPPMTGAPSVASPPLLRLSQRHLRRMSPLL